MRNNKENIKPPCNLAASFDAEDEIKSVPETPRKAKKNRVSGCDIRLHQTIKSNNNKKSNKTKGIIAPQKTSTPVIAIEQPATSGEAANIASISLAPNIDNTQQSIFGERDIEDIMAFIDEESWKSKMRVDQELWDTKMQEATNNITTSMGDNTVLDLLDINMDHFEQMVGSSFPVQNNEVAPEPPIIQIENTHQGLHINDSQNTVEAVCITNNQTAQQQYSTIDTALFQEMMAYTNPIDPPAINQIIQPATQDMAVNNIHKSTPLGPKKQPEDCLGWTIMEKRKPLALARRAQQQQQQQSNKAEQSMITQPHAENPPQDRNKEKVLIVKLKGAVQFKRSYEQRSNEIVAGENVVNSTNEIKKIKHKDSNNQKCSNTKVYMNEAESERSFDSESKLNNNINDIGLKQIDQPKNFQTESLLNQILVTAEIHNSPDNESILNTSSEIRNEKTDISVALNDLNTVNTVESLESINLTNNDNDDSIPSIQSQASDCFNADLDLNDFIIGSKEIACRTGFVQVKIGNHDCTFDASSPYVRFSEHIVFSLIDQFSDEIQSGSYVSFNQIYCDVSIIFEGYGHGTNDVMGVNIGSLLNKKSFITSHLNNDTNKRDCLFRAIAYVAIRSEKMKNAAKGANGLNIRAYEIDAKARLLSLRCELPLELAATPVHLEKIALKLDIRIACYMVDENTGLIKTFYTNADLNNKNKTTVLLCLHKNCYYPLLYPKSLIRTKNILQIFCCIQSNA
ncbi:unnamed protein product [Rotaria magnacalcarata]|uniref:Uncharacterized protein n=1 Tax=Rotaria magnacalcarata TaxID=392030 RepID=A0A820FQA6_9BILA|nr:unnamed protein product [Rotaria magnacalcarata]